MGHPRRNHAKRPCRSKYFVIYAKEFQDVGVAELAPYECLFGEILKSEKT